jgi:hypothetical protein
LPDTSLEISRAYDGPVLRAGAAEIVRVQPPAPRCPGDAARRAPLELRAEGSVVAFARGHKVPLSVAGWIGGTDVTALLAHTAGGPDAYLAVLGLSAAAGLRVAWKFRPKARRRRRARRYAAGAWAAGSAAALTGTWAGAANGPAQAVILLGGLACAAPHLWQHRRRPDRPGPALAPLPVADQRLEVFEGRFCQDGFLLGADLHSLADIPDGFAFGITLAPHSRGTTQDVVALRPKIAALYDVPADQVTVEYGPKRSERRARVAVLTADAAHERDDRWDGASTYDPATGCVEIGRFADSAPARWMLHKPRSGAASGVLAGVIGSGKSHTVHVVACEAGQAAMCAVCGPARSCPRCDMRRVCALWMGDPQRQPFSVWRGRADLTAWGPESCVRMLQWAHAAMTRRAAYFGQVRWTDHRGRVNAGKGWFDPSPAFPVILVVIDEWPKIAADKELARVAVPLAVGLALEARKVGIGLIFIGQVPDVSMLGDRAVREMLAAFNALCHRTDRLSTSMLGIEGNPVLLPAGVHGLGYINGPDRRPSAIFRTKNIPEYAEPGDDRADVREIADRIAADPAALDDAVLAAIRPLGYTGPRQVIEIGRDTLPGLPELTDEAAQHRGTGHGPGPGVPPALLRALLDARGELDLYDVMLAAGVDALTASRALAALAAGGGAVQTAPDRYARAG